jgi:hypothetical protein
MAFLAKFGIDEIYIHPNLPSDLLEKLNQRAVLSLDGEDTIVQKHASHDMVLVFNKLLKPTGGNLYRFLKFLKEFPDQQSFIKDNTLINEAELFLAIKNKDYVLVTPRTLQKNVYTP